MMGSLAFFQPFKHPDILSINTGAQMVVLFVLFAAMFLLVNSKMNDGSSSVIAVTLVFFTIAPLGAGVKLALRLPADAHIAGATDAITADVVDWTSSMMKGRFRTHSKEPSVVRGAMDFRVDNPMRANDCSSDRGVEVPIDHGNKGIASRQSDALAASEPQSLEECKL